MQSPDPLQILQDRGYLTASQVELCRSSPDPLAAAAAEGVPEELIRSLMDSIGNSNYQNDEKPGNLSHSLVGEALIGRGAQGTVFRSRERLVQRDVAIKVLELRTASTIAIRRFVGEARALERIDHPGVPTVYGLSQTGDRLVLKMRLILAPSLETLVGDSEALGRALLALERAARVVAVAHRRGIVHRDLKPEHILAGPEQVQVIDWGLARNLRDEEEGERGESGSGEHTRLGAILGTPGYMSPEQADGQAARASPQSDIYSLGRILLFLLLGRHPRPEELPGVGPPELCSIARRALRLHPEQYGSADEFAEDLRRFRERQPVLAHHYPLRRRVQFGLDRLKRPALAGLALAAVLGGIWELRGWQGRMDAQRAEEEEDQQWSDKIRDAWSNNVQPENVVAVVMAGAFRPNLAEARSMFLAWEAAQPPHYLERVRLRDFETCGGRKLLLSRGGAACFGSLAGGLVTWWPELHGPGYALGAGLGYDQWVPGLRGHSVTLATSLGGVEHWTVPDQKRAAMADPPSSARAYPLDDHLWLWREDSALSLRSSEQLLWREEEVGEVVQMEWLPEALVQGRGGLRRATRAGLGPPRCPGVAPVGKRPRWAWPDQVFYASNTDGLPSILDIDRCQIASWRLDFPFAAGGGSPSGDTQVVAGPDGHVQLRRRDGVQHRHALPIVVGDAGFESEDVFRVTDDQGQIWRLQITENRQTLLPASIVALYWSEEAELLVQTAAGAWHLPWNHTELGVPQPGADLELPGGIRVEGRVLKLQDKDRDLPEIPERIVEYKGRLYVQGEKLSLWEQGELRWSVPIGRTSDLVVLEEAVVAATEGRLLLFRDHRPELLRSDEVGAVEVTGTQLRVGKPNGRVALWDTRTWQEEYGVSSNGFRSATQGATRMILGGDRGGLRIIRSGQVEAERVYGPASVEALALSPDEKWLAVGYATGLVQVWDLSWLDLSREQAKARIEDWTGLTLKAGKLVPLGKM